MDWSVSIIAPACRVGGDDIKALSPGHRALVRGTLVSFLNQSLNPSLGLASVLAVSKYILSQIMSPSPNHSVASNSQEEPKTLVPTTSLTLFLVVPRYPMWLQSALWASLQSSLHLRAFALPVCLSGKHCPQIAT